ncbi:hypothetical protein G9A89_015582 [Geosiphon pyriformis]|nr:hypothetical protein G9A89_015582 [Geosiphon pyriformis]
MNTLTINERSETKLTESLVLEQDRLEHFTKNALDATFNGLGGPSQSSFSANNTDLIPLYALNPEETSFVQRGALRDFSTNTSEEITECEKIKAQEQNIDIIYSESTETQSNEQQTLNPPAYALFSYDFSKPLTPIYSTRDMFNETVKDSLKNLSLQIGLGENYESNATNGWEDNFFKIAKWSPDGTSFRNLRPSDVFETNEELLLKPVLLARIGETVYDCCWYPMMSSQDPGTCGFLVSSRDHPVHLWDAFSAKSRCSYTIIDHREQVVGPNSLAFNLDGSKIYCGYKNMIEVFETSRPGRESEKYPTTPKRKSKEGQKGVITCFAFNPDYSGLYAAGSYSKTVGLYDESNNSLLFLLRALAGGVTQVKFSTDGHYLFSASRRDNRVLCWDIRNTGEILYKLDRKGDTNQRLSFDIDPTGKYLTTGNQDGQILVYDISTGTDKGIQRKVLECSAHGDSISAVEFHRALPLLVSCSGQRKYHTVDENDLKMMENSWSRQKSKSDNSLKIWKIYGNYEWYPYKDYDVQQPLEIEIDP